MFLVKKRMYQKLPEMLQPNYSGNISDIEFPPQAETLCQLQGNGNEDALFFYHGDHLSSNQLITDLYGNVSQAIMYAPFGQIISEYNALWHQDIIPNFTFNAKPLDVESGLMYYDARYYDPNKGTYNSRDVYFEKQPWMSPYAQCNNNPVNFIDPDGRDPIYAQNFWGNVKRIGDDGQCGSGSYLVQGSVKKDVKAATKAGAFYAGSLAESTTVMHIPTGQIQKDVQQTATATINSGTSPETRVENGGHSLYGDANARIWDAGTPMQTRTLSDGSIEQSWGVKPFRIGGKDNQIGGLASSIQFFWHIHPNGSTPSGDKNRGDIYWMSSLRENGFTGNAFLIDVNNGRVTFFNEKGALMNIKYDDFKRMGNQEDIK